ncbi:MAG: hypothetical protein COA47_12835 [Robiginitomaculum sp.]|nr:MAG: hypothetical protein COA47_12835 [Robiginitomaculum sp.]
MDYSFLKDAEWRRSILKAAFGKGFVAFMAFAFAMGLLCFVISGEARFVETLISDWHLIRKMVVRILVALSIAALIWVMMPRDKISALVGNNSGLRGILIALVAGCLTPGGPSSAYALLAVLASGGADVGALIAYITSWSILGMQRILIWDVPFMGFEFSSFRFLISLPLPIVAGLIARTLSRRFKWDLRKPKESDTI